MTTDLVMRTRLKYQSVRESHPLKILKLTGDTETDVYVCIIALNYTLLAGSNLLMEQGMSPRTRTKHSVTTEWLLCCMNPAT